MALNVTTAIIGGGCQRAAASPSLAQWDRGQILKITGVDLPVTYNVEFCCQGDLTTTTMLGGADGVEIPNLLLQRGLPIIAYLVLHEGQDDRETEYWITIYVKQRAMPPSVTPDPEQADIIDQLVAALNEGVTAAENAAAQAEAQVEHYPTVIDGTWHVWNALTESWVDTEVPATGPAGRGITSVTQNADYTLTLTFTDGTDWTTPTPVRGATGATPNLTIGTVTTGAAGSSAAASITGTAENPVLSLTIPQGLKGDPGNGDAIAPTFSASTAYPAGAYVIYNGSLYRFTAAHAAGAWTGTDAVAAVLGTDVAELKGDFDDAVTILNQQIDSKAPVIIDTASGAIASFSDGADGMPIKSLTVSIEPVQSGTGDPSPTNVRPISGWTGLSLTRDGNNFADISEVALGTIDTQGREQASTTRLRTGYIPTPENTQFAIAFDPSTINSDYLFFYDASKTFISYRATPSNKVFTTPDNCAFVRFTMFKSGGISLSDLIALQVNLGASALPFEEFTGETIPISWQTEAGTVYKANINVVSGVLTNVCYYALLNDPNKWIAYTGAAADYQYNGSFVSVGRKFGARELVACSAFQCSKGNSPLFCGWLNANNSNFIGLTNAADYITLEQVKTMASNNQIAIVFELATPVTYQLDPVTVSTLLGQNNIFADCGDVECAYPCDTKLYIEKLTAPTEDDLIADHAITSGQFFMIGNTLYKATAAIANGATITVGTNAQQLSLADALNLLNT